jgi:hypothetical protein
MTAEEFDAIVEARVLKIKETLVAKAKEYATGRDRLHNFKRGSLVKGEHPTQTCVGFLTKHLVSVLDLLDELAVGDGGRLRLFDEKMGDVINYLILLEALVKETQAYKDANNPAPQPPEQPQPQPKK